MLVSCSVNIQERGLLEYQRYSTRVFRKLNKKMCEEKQTKVELVNFVCFFISRKELDG